MISPAHLPTTVLDGYLHRTLTPTDHQQIRTHLDNCEPCWQAWNRHRWDAARPSPLYAQLAEFLGAQFRPYFDSSRALAAEWDAVSPRTDHDIAQFFRTSTSYLYNLAIWDASGNRPDYLTHALPILARHGTRTVLDYGCGIGRAHGRQRFHYRRPFPEITAVFARHGLIPSVATAGTPIMYWTRDRLARRCTP